MGSKAIVDEQFWTKKTKREYINIFSLTDFDSLWTSTFHNAVMPEVHFCEIITYFNTTSKSHIRSYSGGNRRVGDSCDTGNVSSCLPWETFAAAYHKLSWVLLSMTARLRLHTNLPTSFTSRHCVKELRWWSPWSFNS